MENTIGSFGNLLPVDIRFGVGRLEETSSLLEAAGIRRPFVVADPAVLGLPPVGRLVETLRATCSELGLRAVSPGEPTLDDVDDVGADMRGFAPDAVIAIGGGSALDTAKGARLLLANVGSIRRYTWPGEPEPILPPTVPLITVPTTAGTGSEVTGGVVMTDSATGMKVAAPSPHNRAQHCIVDPALTLTLPAGPTLWGGLDALGQAIGSVVSQAHTPVGDGLGLEAVRLAVQAIPALHRTPDDLDARVTMACAALLAGLAMNVSEAGTEHSLAHPLGGLFHLPHGLTVALMLVESMEHDRQYVPERFERVADALGAPRDGTADGSRAVAAVRRLLAEVECPTLGASGITSADVNTLTESALAGWIPVEPGPWTRDDVAGAYKKALAVVAR
jgi:choline dehydrogenase